MNLSPDQKRIVEAADGHYLVVASAGAGKTRVLTERVRHLIADRKVRSRVLSLTFTNKAAEEMRQRIRSVPDLQDRAYIGTIHSFCQSILESHGRVVGLVTLPAILEREADRIAMLEKAFEESPELRGHLRQHPDAASKRKFLYRVLEKISFCKRDWGLFQNISSNDRMSEVEARVFREYQDHLASQGVIDFDDILLLALRILTERPAVADIYRRTYRYLCVDEGQDLNAVQYALIRTLGSEARSVLIVGDPNQAIYGFNGSSHRFMMEDFPRDFGAETIELRQNYRSSKAVIRVANALYPESNEVDKAALEGKAVIVRCLNEAVEADWIVHRIQELLEKGEHSEIEGRLTLDRIVVLARNRFVFAPLQQRLENAGIAFHLRQPSGGAVFESDLGKMLDLSIRLAINPRNQLIGNELCRILGIPPKALASEKDGVPILEEVFQVASAEWQVWLGPLLDFVKAVLLDINRFSPAMQTLEGAWMDAATKADMEKVAGEQAFGDLEFLRDCWGKYSRKVAGEARSLGQFRNQMATGEILPHMTGEGLMLAPVHTVKGLEFEVVFLIGMVEGTFPDYRAVKSGGSALAEERNDAFVAATRAKRLLYMTWPVARFMPWDDQCRVKQSPSRYLREIEECRAAEGADAVPLQVAESQSPYGTFHPPKT
ncbi:MAG: ATP-dependent helicase [Opitutales bacterium]|nr:ATP-dependent helicase [Opitutales bacterium]